MKKLLVCFTLLSTLLMVGCSDEGGNDNGGVTPGDTLTLDQAHSQLSIPGDLNNVMGNLVLTTQLKNVSITWVSSDNNVVTNEGVVTVTSQDQKAKLTATLSLDSKTKTKEFNITVKGDTTDYDTVAEALAMNKDSSVVLKATVSKMRGEDFFIQDSTGGLFVFCNGNSKNVTEGDVVVIKGKIGEYGQAKQLAPTEVTVRSSGSKVSVTEITDFSDSTIKANMYNIVSIKNVSIDSLGTYNTSSDFNFTVSSNSVQLTAHVNKRNSDSDKSSIKSSLELVSQNSVINLNKVVVSQYNGKTQLLICSGSDIEEANVSTEVKIERIKADLAQLTSLEGTKVTYKMNLVTESLYSSTITWSSNNSAISSTGVVTRPEEGEADVNVKLTYTVTVDGQTFTGNINVIVPAKTGAGDLLPYYEAAAGYEGAQLEAALKKIISSGVKSLSYDNMWTTCEQGNEDPKNKNNVILLYGGNSVPKNDHVSGSTGWNREHTWPQSLSGNKTDAHHVMPTDNKTNSTRGNNKFGMGGSPVYSSYGFHTTSKSTGSTFEPRDEVKGDVARICMYMSVRYGHNINTVIPLSLAMQWHEQDPVDEFELNRNNVIYGFQNNRNPFIDNPEFATLIWG